MREHISFVHSTYTDIRSEELSDLALEETESKSDAESMEKMYMEMRLGYDLGKDKEYQNLVKKRDELIASYDFVKNKKKSYDIICKKISDIYESRRREIFGDFAEEPESEMILKSPYEVLAESISYLEECDAEQSEKDVKELTLTDEEKSKMEKIFKECIEKFEIERKKRLQEKETGLKEDEKIFHS